MRVYLQLVAWTVNLCMLFFVFVFYRVRGEEATWRLVSFVPASGDQGYVEFLINLVGLTIVPTLWLLALAHQTRTPIE